VAISKSFEVGGADTRQGIQSVEIGVSLLRALAATGGAATLGDLAKAAGMDASKAHRYLVSFTRTGLVTRLSSGTYDLGPTSRLLGVAALGRSNEVAVASDFLTVVRDQTGHSVNLTVWGDGGPVLVRWEYGNDPLPITVRVGATLPLLESSAGQMFVACLSDSFLSRCVPPVSADVAAIIRGRVAKQGFSVVNSGTIIPGIASVSVAVPILSDPLPLVITVVLPTHLMTPEEQATIERSLAEAAEHLKAEFGL